MGLNFFLSIIRNFCWRHQIVIWERSIWIVTLQHMNSSTVSFLRQYSRCIIKIATVRFYDVFTIKFCNNVFHEVFIFCCLALLVEAAQQLWVWEMLKSILAFDISPGESIWRGLLVRLSVYYHESALTFVNCFVLFTYIKV